MRTPTTAVALATMMVLATMALASCSSCASCASRSSRACDDAMDAYARAAQSAPHDESDRAYDDFVALAARAPQDGDGNCRAVAALAARVASVRAEPAARGERADVRSSTRRPSAPQAVANGSVAAADDALGDRADDGDNGGGGGDRGDDGGDEDDDEYSAGRSFSVASSPNGVVLPVNVSRAVADAQASSPAHACVTRCADDQAGCLGRCDKTWNASGNLRDYRACQSRCNEVEVKCRRACKPPRRTEDEGRE